MEVAALAEHEARETAGVLDIPGSAALLRELPPSRWAVVTSGVRAVAEHRLRHIGLPMPPIMVRRPGRPRRATPGGLFRRRCPARGRAGGLPRR